MSQNPLVPSFRFPGIVSDPSVPKAVSDVMRLHANALTDIYQAIPALKSQIDSLTKGTGSTTIINSSSSSGGGGGGSNFPGLGSVNNLQGDVSYTNQPSDNGALLLFGDASPVAVQLTSGVSSPYFFFAQNWGAGLVTFTPTSGTISYIGNPGSVSMPLADGYSAFLVFDGTDWWAETLPVTPIATDSSLGIVQPDGVTIGIDSGAIFTQITVDSGPPGSMPSTLGNPFYFDSTASPWQGYVWFGNSWHEIA